MDGKILILVIMLLGSSLLYAEHNMAYSIQIEYDNGKLSLNDLALIEGEAPDRLNQPESGYLLKVISFDGEILHSFKFTIDTSPSYAAMPDMFDENGTYISTGETPIERENKTSVLLIVPYYENARTVEINDETGELALSIDVSKYSKQQQEIHPACCAIPAIGGLALLAILISKKLGKKRKK